MSRADTPSVAVAVRDRASCERWLAAAPLSDPLAACDAMADLLEELRDSELAGAAFLAILDQLRQPILYLQEQMTRQFAGRPVPLPASGHAAFLAIADVWHLLARCYLRAVDDLSGVADQRSLPIQWPIARAMEAVITSAMTHHLGRQALAESPWVALNALLGAAERAGIGAARIDHDPSCPSVREMVAFYALVELAEPERLAPRELDTVRGWASHWSGKVRWVRDAAAAHLLGIDLDSAGAPRANAPGATLALDLTSVESGVRRRRQALAEGVEPRELGLAAETSRADAARLLDYLERCWCERRVAAPAPLAAARDINMLTEIAHVAAPPSRALGVQQRSTYDYTRPGEEMITVFDLRRNLAARSLEWSTAEPWQIVASGQGLIAARRRGRGAPIEPGRLVAIGGPHESAATLGEVLVAREHAEGEVEVTIELLLGAIERVTVRMLTEDGETLGARIPAIVLTPTARPPTVLAKRGELKPGARIAISHLGGERVVRLGEPVRRTVDFERYAPRAD